MTARRVVVTAPLPGPLETLLEGCSVTILEAGTKSVEDLRDAFAQADAAITLLSDPVTTEVLDASSSLKVIANYAVGYDNVDVEAATRAGVTVCHTPGVLTAATADLAMALILSTTRRVVEGHAMMVEGRFDGWGPDLLLGSSLEGKVLGVVGLGRIGSAVAKRAKAFGMEIIYTARSPRDTELCERVDIDELTSRSDIITIHCPLTAETRHLFDRDRLRSMKKGAYLINTARGPVVDEKALVEVLGEGHLAGAGLDVFEREPEMAEGLAELPSVVLLPHLGSATTETRREMVEMVCTDVLRALDGQNPLHQVPEQRG